jgi:RHS repeat-associated protein
VISTSRLTLDIREPWLTSKERDAETGLDYLGARYFAAPQGRFTSPNIAGPSPNKRSFPDQPCVSLPAFFEINPSLHGYVFKLRK